MASARPEEWISSNMRAVRSKNGRAELALRRCLHRQGLRYRIHDRSLPGTPDITFVSAAIAVFVDGEFWHGKILREEGPQRFLATFKSDRRNWWLEKISKNVERDARVDSQLKSLGYAVIRVWDREVQRSPLTVSNMIANLVRRRSNKCRKA